MIIRIVVGLSDSSQRSPKVVIQFAVPCSNDCVGRSQMSQSEEARAVSDVGHILINDGTKPAVPDPKEIVRVEVAHVSLLSSACAVESPS